MLVACLFFLLVTFFLNKEYKRSHHKKLKRKVVLLSVWVAWIVCFALFLYFGSSSILNAKAVRLSFIFYGLFVLYHVFFLSYIRAAADDNQWYTLLFLPATWFFVQNILVFNKPTYNGAMDGFAALNDMYTMLMGLIIYPTFMFSFSMLECNSKIKGVVMIFIALLSGVLGVLQSVGREGYLADDTGGIFAFVIVLLLGTGVFYLIRDKLIMKYPC